ncbi:MAG: group 1 truncated hemoglobin [Myxococcales bacterium]|jgi:hemoglobin|nr:group 1 truncated hemoglobin [Myxococcales bacterium]
MNLRRLALVVVFPSLLVWQAAACGGKPQPKPPETTEPVDAGVEDAAPPEPPKPKSLFERLGGKDAIAKVVDSFVKNVAADPRVNKRFKDLKGPKLEKFKAHLVDQICEASGGDCKYTGKTMKEVHKTMKITEADWNAVVEDLKAALDENKVGEQERGDLFAAIAGMKEDIVDPATVKKPK